MTPLLALLSAAHHPLVLHDTAAAGVAAELAPGAGTVQALGALPPAGGYDAVVLVTTDRTGLRRAAARLPPLEGVAAVACLLTDDPVPPSVPGRPDWPPLASVDAVRLADGGSASVVHLTAPLPADEVLRELARLCVPARWEPLPTGDGHHGRLDPASLNPIGFLPDAPDPLAELAVDGGVDGGRVVLQAPDLRLDLTAGAGSSVVAALRTHRGVRVAWDRPGAELAAAVTGLAMAGVPLVGDPPPAAAREWLGAELHAELTALSGGGEAEQLLADRLHREEVSIALRRTALTHHGPRAAAAARGGSRFPTCSVVLATRRPEQLAFAVRQVARQQGPEVELVVVGHGFEPDTDRVREVLGSSACQVLSRPAGTLFGDVLEAGVGAATGEVVVKMDDDDWYGPHFLHDLMLAREYSGAEVVGAPAEFVHVAQVDRTVRTRAGGEQFARLVAGGTIALPRDLLHDLGGFRPVRRFVDRQLLDAASAAGMRVYRGHGLGYLLRRTAQGHTWDPGLDFFLDPDRVVQQWDGFTPSAVLAVDPQDRPGASGGGPP